MKSTADKLSNGGNDTKNQARAADYRAQHPVAWVIKSLAFPVIILVIAGIGLLNIEGISKLYQDPDIIQEYLQESDWKAMLLYVIVQVVQVFIFILPGDIVQFAGGYAFGMIPGFLLSMLGLLIGTIINFSLARWLGRAFVESLFSVKSVERMEHILQSPRSQTGFFLLFLIPGLPGKDLLCYIGGISVIGMRDFLFLVMTARIPGILASSLMGSATSLGNYRLAIIMLIIAVLMVGTGFIYRKNLHAWIEKHSHHTSR